MANLFRRISVRITRADGSTVFFLDDLNCDYKTFADIQLFLSSTLEKSVFDYVVKNNIRGCVFQLKQESTNGATEAFDHTNSIQLNEIKRNTDLSVLSLYHTCSIL